MLASLISIKKVCPSFITILKREDTKALFSLIATTLLNCNVSFVEPWNTKKVIFSWLEDRNVLLKLESVLNDHPKIIFTDIGNCIGWCNFEC